MLLLTSNFNKGMKYELREEVSAVVPAKGNIRCVTSATLLQYMWQSQIFSLQIMIRPVKPSLVLTLLLLLAPCSSQLVLPAPTVPLLQAATTTLAGIQAAS